MGSRVGTMVLELEILSKDCMQISENSFKIPETISFEYLVGEYIVF